MRRPNRKARRAHLVPFYMLPADGPEVKLRRQIAIMRGANAYLLEKQAERVKLPSRLMRKLEIATEVLSYIASTSADMNSAASAHVAIRAIEET